ncbi:hypothetical protein [Lentisalinibacter sediminis]|uniref:hypothetical protein n=1 Tax=Lentisalinibacter sediminis TaxID=2992237 RepID=UPI0038675E3A
MAKRTNRGRAEMDLHFCGAVTVRSDQDGGYSGRSGCFVTWPGFCFGSRSLLLVDEFVSVIDTMITH